MYFSRIQLLSDVSPRQLEPLLDSVYQQHKYVWRLFSDDLDRRRDFLYRQEQVSNGRPSFYAVSERPPKDLDQIWKLEVKEYNPMVKVGDVLQFDMRVNPTVGRSSESSSKRHDVVMDRKHKMGWKDLVPEKRPLLQELIHEAGVEWLDRRCGNHGFEIVPGNLQIDGYTTYKFFKRGAGPVTISTLDFKGVLRVTDAAQFLQSLRSGVGRAKSFGCGLLLVRRI